MYDVVIVGRGLAGLLTAIRAREENKRVAVIAEGTGKIIQSSGFMDLVPTSSESLKDAYHLFQQKDMSIEIIDQSINWFKSLMIKLNIPYEGAVHQLSPVVTGAGYIKETALYPNTVRPIPEKGNILVVGLKGINDFQPNYVKENLKKERPNLLVSALSVDFFDTPGRFLSQVDAARGLDNKQTRKKFIDILKKEMIKNHIPVPDLVVFPSCLGIINYQDVINDFELHIGPVTEAPGLPPNAAAIRLNDALYQHAVKKGVRFHEDETVFSVNVVEETVTEVFTGNRVKPQVIKLKQLIIASGGILGGGLDQTATELIDRTISQPIKPDGTLLNRLNNVYHTGSSSQMPWSDSWIAGGIYTICSSYSVPFLTHESVKGRDDKCYINQA